LILELVHLSMKSMWKRSKKKLIQVLVLQSI